MGGSLDLASLFWLDIIGIAVFAISGALVAAERGGNFVTFAFFAAVTGMGGGTLRDLLIGAPVFWVSDNVWLLLCLTAALIVWLSRHVTVRALLWFDAVGLVAYAVYGTEKALQYGIAPVPASFMGIMTATAGGIIRDVLAHHPSILLRPEVYVTAAALTAMTYATATYFGVAPVAAALLAIALGFALRSAAIVFQIKLPSYSAS